MIIFHVYALSIRLVSEYRRVPPRRKSGEAWLLEALLETDAGLPEVILIVPPDPPDLVQPWGTGNHRVAGRTE